MTITELQECLDQLERWADEAYTEKGLTPKTCVDVNCILGAACYGKTGSQYTKEMDPFVQVLNLPWMIVEHIMAGFDGDNNYSEDESHCLAYSWGKAMAAKYLPLAG